MDKDEIEAAVLKAAEELYAPRFKEGDAVYTLPDIAGHRHNAAMGMDSTIPTHIVVNPCRPTGHCCVLTGRPVQFYVDIDRPGYGFHEQNLVLVEEYDPEAVYVDWYHQR